MGLISFIRNVWEARSLLRDPQAFREFYDLDSRSVAGVNVNSRSALGLSSYWHAVNLVSSSVAKLPLVVYRRLPDDDREKDTGHPAYPMLRRQANPQLRASAWLRLVATHVLMHGNHYSVILRDNVGRPRQLIPLAPWSTHAAQRDGELVYQTRMPDGSPRTLLSADVFHARGLSDDGITGLDPLRTLAPSLGINIAADEFAARWFAGGCLLSSVLKVPAGMKPEARNQALKDWSKISGSLGRAGKTGVLYDGLELQELGTDVEKNQLLQSREFGLVSTGNATGVDPSKLGHSAKTSYASLEVAQQAFLSESLDPLLCEIEAEAFAKLLSPSEQEDESHFVEFARQSLLKPDLAARYAAYSVGRTHGWLSVNDVRKAENMPSIGPAGDIYTQQLNVAPAGDPPPEPEEDQTDDDADDADESGPAVAA